MTSDFCGITDDRLSVSVLHRDKEILGLEYIAAVVHQCRENNAQAAFDAGPECAPTSSSSPSSSSSP
jgi:hypothetical protein